MSIIIFNCYYFKCKIGIDDMATFTKYMDLSRIELVEKSVVTMKFVVYHDGVFYMRDKFFGKSFSLLSDMIKEYCSLSLNPYLPHIDEVCLGQFPGIYYFSVCTVHEIN